MKKSPQIHLFRRLIPIFDVRCSHSCEQLNFILRALTDLEE